MSAESPIATITLPSSINYTRGDTLGSCDARVLEKKGLNMIVVQAHPSIAVCRGCPLSANCSAAILKE